MKEINDYIGSINWLRTQSVTEQSYYRPLSIMVEKLGGSGIHVIEEAKTQEAGRPDFTVLAENGDTIGYIEAKTPKSDLIRAENTEQLKRYLITFPNLILTDFYTFRLYSKGSLEYETTLEDGGLFEDISKDRENNFLKLISVFLSKTTSADAEVKTIAEQLAWFSKNVLKPSIMNRLIIDIDTFYTKHSEDIDNRGIYAVCIDFASDVSYLYGAYIDFKAALIHDLDEERFVDMYVQTITYGLLTAKMLHDDTEGEFNRKSALFDIHKGFGVLHTIFKFIATDDLSDDVESSIDDIVDILVRTNPGRVLNRYYVEDRGEDWFVQFYETFLSEYNPEERKKRGVYYTPDKVVSYITRSVNILLKKRFCKELGFGDISVEVIDPASGTLSFLASACQLAIKEKKIVDGDGMINEFIRDHVLKHFYGYELMMTPYVLGHLKMKSLLGENGYSLTTERSRLLLVNALDVKGIEQAEVSNSWVPLSDIGRALIAESRCAVRIHDRKEIIAVIGNPPYSGISSNEKLFNDEIELYKYWVKEDREGVKKERNILPLSDDYIKFIRLAHKRIDDNPDGGVVGLITNNSYLGGLIHRGMRRELLKSFNEIYILNLHGNAMVDVKGDKNVFNIKQGVSIVLFVKTSNSDDNAKVYYRELVGSRDYKLDYLKNSDISDFYIDDDEIDSCSPYYFFEPKDFLGKELYDGFVSISDVFKELSSGITTARDGLTIKKNKQSVHDIVKDIEKMDKHDVGEMYGIYKDISDWTKKDEYKIKKIKSDVGIPNDENIVPILYRPFDAMFTYYTGKSGGFMMRPRGNIMKHMLHDNIALVGMRQYLYDVDNYNYVFVSDKITDSRIFVSNRGAGSVMPLYRYSRNGSRRSNVSLSLVTELSKAYNNTPTPEDVFYYIYGILYSNIYREKYSELLKIDFPKIPFTAEYNTFMYVSNIGKKIADLHLMKHDAFDTSSIKYYGRGNNVVDKISYDEANQRIVINNVNYFEPVSKDVWEYQIGGYIVMQKWLKDRRRDVLTNNDVNHYRYIGEALKKTIELQAEIDVMYDDIDDGEILSFEIRRNTELTDH